MMAACVVNRTHLVFLSDDRKMSLLLWFSLLPLFVVVAAVAVSFRDQACKLQQPPSQQNYSKQQQ